MCSYFLHFDDLTSWGLAGPGVTTLSGLAHSKESTHLPRNMPLNANQSLQSTLSPPNTFTTGFSHSRPLSALPGHFKPRYLARDKVQGQPLCSRTSDYPSSLVPSHRNHNKGYCRSFPLFCLLTNPGAPCGVACLLFLGRVNIRNFFLCGSHFHVIMAYHV